LFDSLKKKDFGRDGFCCQRDVAVELERAAKSTFASFVVNTGDSFYGNGITNVKNEQVRTSFLNVYNTPTLKQLQFWSVLGNHDYRGDSNAVLQLHGAYQRFNILVNFFHLSLILL
jgi:tartrate-resistant acid phosphatase type 5